MKWISSIVLFTFFTTTLMANDVASNIFTKTNEFLITYVNNGLVDYNEIKNNPNELNELVNAYANESLTNYSGNAKKALLINAYNVFVIKTVIDNYPTNSPMDIDGFFDQKTNTIFGKSLTLNQLEKEVLFGEFKDARLHFVLVCAAIGCPKIANYAYTPSNIENQLSKETRKALNSAAFLRVEENNVNVSEIFKWYKDDFTANGKSIIQYINQFRNTAIPENATLGYYTYDWNLNKKK